MRSIIVLFTAVALSGCAGMDRRAAHHAPSGAFSPEVTAAQMDMRMKSMQEMHEKMMSAKTPAERQALMADHMKAMQDGMATMEHMKPSGGNGHGMPMSPEMMGKRMDMLEMMMQMMMDREAASAPARQ